MVKRKAQENNEENKDSSSNSKAQKLEEKGQDDKMLYVILEKANLEIVKVKNESKLLNADDHSRLIQKYQKDPQKCRPDILHQCLLMLQDSPLNQTGHLQVFIHSEKDQLIKIHHSCRIPRTFRRFAGLMVQLLEKKSVRSEDGKLKLMEIIKNPVLDHLPEGCHKISTSFSSAKWSRPIDLVPEDGKPVAIVVGAMTEGQAAPEHFTDCYRISEQHLSGAYSCAVICAAFARKWDIF